MSKLSKLIIALLVSALILFFGGLMPMLASKVLFGRGITQGFKADYIILIAIYIGISMSIIINNELWTNRLPKILSFTTILTVSTLIILWLVNADFEQIEDEADFLIFIGYILLFICIPFIFQKGIKQVEGRFGPVSFGGYFIFIISINFISWLLLGRASSIYLGADNLYNFHTYQYDSIYVDYSPSDLPFYKSSVRDFRPSAFEKYVARLQNGFNKGIKVFDPDKIEKQTIEIVKTPIYSIVVIDMIPFFCYIQKNLFAGTSSMGFHSINIWFFKWINIYEEMDWVS